MFPMINKQTRRGATIPDLAGGVNYRDGITEVLDNQITDCKNMWFKDGVLKTRPPVCTSEQHINHIGRAVSDTEYGGTRVFENIKNTIAGEVYTLAALACNRSYQDSDGIQHEETLINFYWIGKAKNIPLSYVEIDELYVTYFVVLYDAALYCFTSASQIFKCSNFETGDWQPIPEEEIYTPIILTHCKTNGSLIMSTQELFECGAVMYEGYNLISNRYKMIYSTVNTSLLNSQEATHYMRYSLYANSFDALNTTVSATITTANGTYTHVVTIETKGWNEEKDFGKDNLKMKVCGKMLWFVTENATDEYGKPAVAQVNAEEYIEDNLEITAYYPISKEEREKNYNKVFSMTRAEWFGGAANGISGGTRLFLCGNTNENEKNLVVYSDLNRPLYFSENSYFYVGDGTSAVTGFGKQSDMLVIFKENETYFTQYNKNDSITAESIINQSVIDYAASSAYFPLTLINPNIGCDLPDTVQLCRNRLVWATTSGKVYTLVSNNQYSERNIYEVGEMVERKLKTEIFLRAGACDWEGHYVLLCGNKAYLMDYNSSGYQYVYSYQKNEDANIKIPWCCWELPLAASQDKFLDPKVCATGDTLCAFGFYDAEIGTQVSIVSVIMSADTIGEDEVITYQDNGQEDIPIVKVPISCHFTTKLFNFGAANYRKNVDSVGLSLGANGGVPMTVTFVTDCGENTETVTLYSGDTENYTAGHIQSVVLNPCIRGVIRFGIRISCDGVMSVDGATINYRLTGPAR